MKRGMLVKNLSLYGLAHGLVDATCIALIFASLSLYGLNPEYFFTLVILYNVLAFATQPLFGYISDKKQKPKLMALVGIILLLISLGTLFISPLLTVIILGLGNALFHVGGGTISLNLTPKKATAPGIYVAPGAIGLLIGGLYGKSGIFSIFPLLILLIISFILIMITKTPKIDYKTQKSNKINNYLELIIILLLLSVAVRALIGSVLVFPWKTNFILLIALTLGIFFGKALGGVFADKFGWIKVGVSSLIISSVLLAFGTSNPFVGILGIFLFNMTMPITLVAISNTLPGKPGFSFGLTTLALIAGALPAFSPLKSTLNNSLIILITTLISASLLYLALKKSNVQN